MHSNPRIIQIVSVNVLALMLFCLDRFLKYYFLKNPSIKIGGDFFYGWLNFHLATNQGIAFGILVNQIILMILIIIILLILISVLVKSYCQKDLLSIFALSVIIVGAFSNLIDRLRFGHVVDYIDVTWFTVFNLADSIITIGVGMLLINILFNKTGQERKDDVT